MLKNKANIIALIVAGGSGTRVGGDIPKQYMPLLGKSILRHTIDAFTRMDIPVQVVIAAAHLPLYQRAVDGLSLPAPIIGGNTRQESVHKGLRALASSAPDHVFIHDAARPFVSRRMMMDICEALSTHRAVIPALPIVDTLKKKTDDSICTVSRESLYVAQTPQAFDYKLISALHFQYSNDEVTDDAALCELAGEHIHFIKGDRQNFKITTTDDLPLAEQYLSAACADIRTGHGYDVHRLIPATPDRRLMLCGIAIPHDQTLEGHSDADVALHALTDALLATIGAGDIGQHFSPKDNRWKNADSSLFLRHAANMITARGGLIAHVDLTIICEEPKIGPHRDAMRACIADILLLPPTRISIKATTSEGLGFTGRGEGIVAEAIATIRLPFDIEQEKAHVIHEQNQAA